MEYLDKLGRSLLFYDSIKLCCFVSFFKFKFKGMEAERHLRKFKEVVLHITIYVLSNLINGIYIYMYCSYKLYLIIESLTYGNQSAYKYLLNLISAAKEKVIVLKKNEINLLQAYYFWSVNLTGALATS